MYRFLSRPKKRGPDWLSLAMVSSGIFIASQLLTTKVSRVHQPLVFEHGVALSSMRASPPFAVLEDEILDIENAKPIPLQEEQQFPLVLNRDATGEAKPIQMITAGNTQLDSAIAKTKMPSVSDASDHSDDFYASDPRFDRQSADQRSNRPQYVSQESPTVQVSEVNNDITVSLSDLGVSQDELAKAFAAPFVAAAQTYHEQQMNVAGHQSGADSKAPNGSPASRRWPNLAAKIANNFNRSSSTIFNPAPSGPAAASDSHGFMSASAAPSADSENVERQLLLQGEIEFAGGVAITSAQDTVNIYREVSGVKLEQGQVWIREGRFEIFLRNLGGNLVSELRNSDGVLVGKTSIPLYRLAKVPANQFKVSGLLIRIDPVRLGLEGNVFDVLDRSQPLALENVAISAIGSANEVMSDVAGHFSDKTIGLGSRMYLRSRGDGLWNSLNFARVGSASTDVSTISEAKIRELLKAVGISKERVTGGIVIGRVTDLGKPKPGMQVSLAETELAKARPVYFDSKGQPDAKLQTTSSSGMYAFVGLPTGLRSIRVWQNDLLSDVSTFYTESESMTVVDLELQRKANLKLRTFDAFNTSKAVPVEIQNIDRTERSQTDQNGKIEFPIAKGNSFLMVQSVETAEYMSSLVNITRDKQDVFLPLVAKEWLALALTQNRVVKSEKLGVVIGFVQSGEPYKVYLDAERTAENVDAQLLYFNSRGEILTNQAYGVPGGGYVIVNAAPGMQTLTIAPLRTEKIYIQTAMVSPDVGAVSIVHHQVGD